MNLRILWLILLLFKLLSQKETFMFVHLTTLAMFSFSFFLLTVGINVSKYSCWCHAVSVWIAHTFTVTGGGLWNKSNSNFKGCQFRDALLLVRFFFFLFSNKIREKALQEVLIILFQVELYKRNCIVNVRGFYWLKMVILFLCIEKNPVMC